MNHHSVAASLNINEAKFLLPSYYMIGLSMNVELEECGPMPNVTAAQPNIDGALCERSVILFLVPRYKVWLTPVLEYRAVTLSM